MADLPACDCREKAGEGLHHECAAACLPLLLHILPATLCYKSALRIYLLLLPTNNAMQIFCHWDHLGAIKQ